MIRMISVLAPLLLFCGATPAAWAQPYSEALIALQFAEGSLYRRGADRMGSENGIPFHPGPDRHRCRCGHLVKPNPQVCRAACGNRGAPIRLG